MAILMVVLFHIDALVLGDAPRRISPLSAYLYGGYSGVSLFFVLSGFLLSPPFLAEADGEPRGGRRNYYLRRALRILPMYYVAWAVAVWFSAESLADVRRWLPFLAFVRYFTPPGALFPFSATWWSLATEVQFYLALPLLPFILRSRVRLASVVGVYLALYAAFLFHPWRVSLLVVLELALSLFGRASLFASGILAAFIYRRHGTVMARRMNAVGWMRRGGADATLLVVLVSLGCLLRWSATIGALRTEGPRFHAWHLLEGVLWASTLLLILTAPLRMKALLCNPVLAKVGTISYSLFLVHSPILAFATDTIRRRFPGHFKAWDVETLVVMTLLFASCLVVSTLTYWAIERPFLARKARLQR